MSTKRGRDLSQDLSNASRSPTPSPSRTPTQKAQRLASESGRLGTSASSPGSATSPPLLCTLPPTCHPPKNAPTALQDARELERHYATYHAHVCAERTCGAVFPDERLLELHHTECHDPLAMVRRERGEKIFACHLATCPKTFLDPKKRRLHLIQAHGFPKEYFFAVTNKGVGGLLKRWGEGASLIRKPWKARDEQGQDQERRAGAGVDGIEVESESAESEGNEGDDGQSGEDGEEKGLVRATVTTITSTTTTVSKAPAGAADKELEKLTDTLGALSLVPPSIHFGRSKPGKMERRPQRKDASKLSKGAEAAQTPANPVDTVTSPQDENVTINIDAALEAFKVEAHVHHAGNGRQNGSSQRGQSQASVLGQGRGRGGRRGRGRVRTRAAPRGRGIYVPN